jgi:hypothetical protein
MSSFIDILGDDIENIKYVYDFLDKEDLEYLIEVAKKAESRFSGSQLHVAANNHLDDASLSDFRKFGEKLNNKIFDVAKEVYKQDFLKETFNFGLNIHKVNSFTDAHVDIIEDSPGFQEPGFKEPVYLNWRDAWDGYLACNLYLNDDYSGGQIYFPEREYLTIKPKANSLIMWPGNKYYIHGIKKTKITSRYVYGIFMKFAEYDKYNPKQKDL